MPEGASVSHRPGLLKQQNKGHKHGKHRSKGELDTANKGKVGVKSITKRKQRDLKRDDRRRQMDQLRSKKREEVIAKKRAIGGSGTAPFLVTVVPLGESANVNKLISELTTCDADASVSSSKQGIIHMSLPRFRQRFSFVIPQIGDVYAVLDACKAADTVLFVGSPDADDVSCISEGTVAQEGALGFDKYGQLLLSAVMAQGLPSPVFVFNDVEIVPAKKRGIWKKNLQKQIERVCPLEKLFVLEKEADSLRLLQHIGSQKQRAIFQRDHRSHLMAEEIEFTQNADDSTKGTLKVSGYIRYKPLSVNGLVHIPGWGDFQLEKIEAPDDPFALKKPTETGESFPRIPEYKLLETANPSLQESLQTENEVDPMSGEQTWPYSEEMQDDEMEQEDTGADKKVKRVPKGTSTYQAAWIKDDADEDDGESEDEEEDEDEEGMEAEDDGSEEEEEPLDEKEGEEDDDEELESVDLTEEGDAHRYDKKVSFADDVEDLHKFKEAKEDELFPDEVDTPREMSARIRFQKYRGLQSFRTSPWDPKENLPLDYSRIFQFENFSRTRKRVMNEENDGAQPGWYVRVHVKDVPSHLVASLPAKYPLVLVGILPHEQRMSVVNVLLKRPAESVTGQHQQPIASKERIIIHCGFRRFAVCPVYSQHTSGNKHKYERFFRPETSVVATFFAPIIFPPASVLAFQEKKDGTQVLIGTGSVLSVNPDRVIIKRAVLSGHPFKVNRKSAVVRFMFFNREDIDWFKPVELKTKWGRRGHIKEPLGTHGHMKCVFDGQLKSQDTVLMTLYKRVFPKWNYNPHVAAPSPLFRSSREVDMEDNTKQLLE